MFCSTISSSSSVKGSFPFLSLPSFAWRMYAFLNLEVKCSLSASKTELMALIHSGLRSYACVHTANSLVKGLNAILIRLTE